MQHNCVGTNGGLRIHGLLDPYQRISTIGRQGYGTGLPPPVTSVPRAEGTHGSKRQLTASSGQYKKPKHQTKIGPFASSTAALLPSRHLRLPCSKCLLHRDWARAVLPSRANFDFAPGLPTVRTTTPPPAAFLGPVLQPALLLPLHLRLPCTAAFASAPIDSWPDCIPRSSPNTSLSPTSSPIFDTVYTRVTSSRDNIYKMPNHRPSTIPFRTNPIADTTTRRNPIKPAITYAKAWPMQSSSDFGEFPLS